MSDLRLIERWMPIEALGEESVRERRSLQALPPIYYLHVWWARRPLVASRAALLASVLPANASHEKFMRALGIHGDPIAAKRRIAQADRKGERLGKDAYGYPRAFAWSPDTTDRQWLEENGLNENLVVLDPTAGGGAIPFEAVRLGATVLSNDLNPVAALIEKATIEYPLRHGAALRPVFDELAKVFVSKVRERLQGVYPEESDKDVIPDGYLWSRTVRCPYCEGLVPLAPSWRLTSRGTGVRLIPRLGTGPGDASRQCDFAIVKTVEEQTPSTIADGDGTCPFPDCRRVIDGDDIKSQAQAGRMGEQLFAVVVKRKITLETKSGRPRIKWERDYRSPRPEDDNEDQVRARLSDKMEEWSVLDFVPNEAIGDLSNYDRGHRMYGMLRWADMFSPRQLLCHGTGVSSYRELLAEKQASGSLDAITRSAFIYLALALDKFLNWNARQATWNVNLESMRSVFDTHNFSMKWTFAEMAPLIPGLGYDWVIAQVGKGIDELVRLVRPDAAAVPDLLKPPIRIPSATINISCRPGDSLSHLEDGSVDAVVMDPPYYDNVMYAELSDFFYVWLKRTAGRVVPELFTRNLTDKDSEAVANSAKFSGQKGAKVLAGRDYQERMARIFEECRRVLKPEGIMTLMFTHKAAGAWDALTTGLMHGGFAITASWPVNTEAEGSLHIKNKAAANSTVFLVCRPRRPKPGEEATYWEDVEPLVAKAVRTRVEEFQKAGIGGVDLYLASFGPALEEFSRHWPLKRGTPRPEPLAKKRRKQAELFEEEFDPYAVTPEDALDAARREVKTWRLNQLTHTKGRGDLDATTSWFVLAWDAFKAPVFSYDEGLRLARAVGADLDGQLIGKICEKKGSDIRLWDSATRAAKSGLGPADGSRAMIDAIHHAAHRGRTRTLDAALDLLKDAGIDNDPQFLAALEAVLEVLPPSRNFVGFDVATGDAESAADDFDALEKLRRLAFSDRVDEPQQLSLFAEEAA